MCLTVVQKSQPKPSLQGSLKKILFRFSMCAAQRTEQSKEVPADTEGASLHYSFLPPLCVPSKHWNCEAISQVVDEVSFRGPFRGQNCKRCSKVWWCLIHKFPVCMNWNQHIFFQQTLYKFHRKIDKSFSRLIFFCNVMDMRILCASSSPLLCNWNNMKILV